jgi:prolyl-tRNA editing enzyme YbaK/EbsC (Cys-tRNA(Pro) deacylase)
MTTETVPDPVERTLRFFADAGVPVRLGRNAAARSCRDAARKRHRLGVTGIPLADELKSFLGRYRDGSGAWRRVMIHCRGDRELDLQRVAQLLRATAVERLDNDELAAMGVEYGTVNPFRREAIVQVFDRGVLERRGVPGTMMTNAGHLEWSVEFRVEQLVEALGDAIVADVVQPDAPADPVSPLGALVANGFGGRALWQSIEDGMRAQLGPAFAGDLPELTVRAVPALALASDPWHRAEAWEAAREAAAALIAQGARTIVLASHAGEAVVPELKALCDRRGVRLVTLLGAARTEEPAVVLGLASESDYANVAAIVHRVQREGVSEGTRQQLRLVLGHSDGAVVLAEPELCELLRTQKKPGRSGRVIVDAFEALGFELARRYAASTQEQP